MQRFLLRFLSVALPVVLIVLAINAIYVYENKVNDADGLREFRKVPDEIYMCSFGTSHAYDGYDFSVLDNSDMCVNFGLPSQSLSYDERILRFYRDRIQPGARVYITVSYQSLYGTSETSQGQFLSKNRRYYKFLSKEYIKEYDSNTAFFVKFLPSLVAEDGFFGVYEKDNKDREISVSEQVVSEEAEAAYKRHIVTDKFDDSGNRIYNEEEIDALYDIIDICKDIGANPTLVTTPFLKEYTNMIEEKSREFYDDFYNMMDKVTRRTGVKYMDYSHDERFSDRYDLFMDSDHLNAKGAEVFTKIIVDEGADDEKV